MSADNRTSNSVRNAKYAIAIYAVNILLGFVSRRVFIHHLGSELLGLSATMEGFLEALNLAELGVGIATLSSLYKPMALADEAQVRDVVALQGWIYRRVAYFVIAASLVLMAFFPLIFRSSGIPLPLVFATFVVMLSGSLLSYFFNYKQVVLSASQMEYRIAFAYKGPLLVRSVLQIVAIAVFNCGYVWWLALHLVFFFIATACLSAEVRRRFPYLSDVQDVDGRSLMARFPQVVTRIRQVFFQRVASVVYQKSSPLILFAFSSLAAVAAYTNYMMIFVGITVVIEQVSRSIAAAVGNLVSKCDARRQVAVFHEFVALYTLLGAFVAICFYSLTRPFVTLWVGGDLVLPHFVVLVVSIVLFVDTVRIASQIFLDGFGLFADVWASVAEAVANVVLSVALGYFWGLGGIVCGLCLSVLGIAIVWKPYYLFSSGFGMSWMPYWRSFLPLVGCAVVSAVVTLSVQAVLPFDGTEGIGSFAALSVATMLVCGGTLLVLGLLVSRGTRSLASRLVRRLGA